MATSFNLLGPLLNPARASHLILGVLDEKLLPIMANVLIQTGTLRSVVVHSMGLDEISCVGPTRIIEVNGQHSQEYSVDPGDFGLPRCAISELRGGDPLENANLLRRAFQGQPGPIANTLILNAAVALYISGLCPSVSAAIPQASERLYSGQVLTLLNQWIEFTHEQ